MKGDHETQNTNNMFPKFHHYQQQQQHHQHHHQQQQHQLHRQLSRECQTSEEDESRSNDNNIQGTVTLTKKIKKDDGNNHRNNGGSGTVGGGGGGGDGATIEVVRRPRGRPPGSKNKPKPPVVITQNTPDECAMRPHVLEIPAGLDVVTAITRFSRRHNLGLCVLSGSGTVANVTLRQPSTTPGATVTFHGRFDILSISATFLPPSSSLSSINGFTISLAGPQGQIFGGSVVGSLIAATTVYVVATSFNSPSYHRLPIEDEIRNSSLSGGAAAGAGGGHPTTSIGSEERESHSTPQNDQSCSMPLYHLPSDVIWAPTARQPPPPF
ncbi:protein of unknown function DUF296 [Macleaya cordata]|uniref:AT-hook motif nuclear-localized protein n=1 Tax=Macleaya cordata TaxID=56857 RepID=A0A200PU95_MACCD|nr:protein of unknown function DUF296 [Macleaya cordata]